MKTYVVMAAKHFPSHHPKKGNETFFPISIIEGSKLHTMRNNYNLWKKRVEEVNAGKAVIQLRSWIGKPYRSKQETWMELKDVGIQKLEWTLLGWFVDDIESELETRTLAKNDGFTDHFDFVHWFDGKLKTQPWAIIHFTKFRY